MQTKAPISFEIQLSKDAPTALAPEVQRRLKKTSQLTLEQINERQKRAALKRAQIIERQKILAVEASEKINLNRERRCSEERASEERLAADLTAKHLTAEEKRTKEIEQIQSKAKAHNKKVLERVEAISKTLEEEAAAKK